MEGKYKKAKVVISIAVATLLVLSVFTVATAGVENELLEEEKTTAGEEERTLSSGEDDLIETVNVEHYWDVETAIEDIVEGDLDALLNAVEAPEYIPHEWENQLETWSGRGSYNNLFINPAHEGSDTDAINDALDEDWIEDPDDIRYLANDVDNDWTVNPFANEDIRFAMQYLNREEIIEDLLYGFGDERYGPIDSTQEVWEEHFEEAIEEKYDVDPEGDEEFMEDIIENAMEEIQDEVAFGEVTGDMEGWYYEHEESDTEEHQIEIKILGSVDDWRLDLAHHTADLLSDFGFDAWVEPVDPATAIPMALFAYPEPYDNLDYHIYTGGWISTTALYYQEGTTSQMYAPWYHFMQTYASEEHWNYDQEGYDDLIGPSDYVRDELGIYEHEDQTVEDLDQRALDLYQGQIESEEEYWEEKIATSQMGFEEAIRVFLTTKLHFYPYDPETVGSTVTESINGYDTYFGPRTMKVEDGVLDTTSVTGEERPYLDNWNIYGGSADVYGEYWRRMLTEYGSWPHPETGEPFEVNTFWSEGREEDPYDRQGYIEMDYEWDDDELVENIEIPEDAVDYIPEENEWMDVDDLVTEGHIEDEYAAVAATIDVHEEHVWHDGSEFSLQDMMFHYARERELGMDSFELPSADTIHAIEWNEVDGTYTVYGDYTFPMEDKIGDHYSFFPETNPLTYYGFDQMHATDDYSYDGAVGDWIHQLSEDHADAMVHELEEVGEVPSMLSEDADAPIPMNFDEWEARVDLVGDFVAECGHAFIGSGPFILEEYDEWDHTMELQRWDQYGYPFPGEEMNGEVFEEGYWREQFEIEEHKLEVDLEGEGTVTVEWDDESYEVEDEETFWIEEGKEVTLTANADEDWKFSHWEGDHPGEESEEIEITITMDHDKQLTAHFEDIIVYELIINAEDGGTTDPEPGTYTYSEGEEVVVEAIADEGWGFDEWTGDYEGTEEEIAITMDHDKEVTAHFNLEDIAYEISNWQEMHNLRYDTEGDYTLETDLDETTEGYDEYASEDATQIEFSEELGFSWGNDAGEEFELTYTPLDEILTAEDAEDGSKVEVEIIDADEGIIELKEDTEDYLYVEYRTTEEIALGWEPILRFTGTFDGQGHEISDLYVDRPKEDSVGLFGVSEGEIENVGIVNVNVVGNSYVGGLVGENDDGKVENSFATGEVSTEGWFDWYVGVLVGYNSGTVSDSHASGEVDGGYRVGGLVGENWGEVFNSHATGEVKGEGRIGGLIGYNSGTISNSYASGDIDGEYELGGLVGTNRGPVENSFYNIDETLIAGENHLTVGGIFDEQYQDWKEDKELDIEDYGSLELVDDHYEISDVQGLRDLLGFAWNEEYKFLLVEDIDLSEEQGLYVPYFVGELDGNGYTVSNLHLDMPFVSMIGMFGHVDGGRVSSLGVIDVEVIGDGEVGGLVGNNDGTVENSYATGKVRADGESLSDWYVGVLVGYNSGTVSDSHASGEANGGYRVGGLIGENLGEVFNSHATGEVSGHGRIGGLIGYNSGWATEVLNSYAAADVSGERNVGGLIGSNSGPIKDSYATGDVSGNNEIGGLVGDNDDIIENSYAVGEVSGEEDVGGLVGLNDEGEIRDSLAREGIAGDLIGEQKGTLTGRVRFATEKDMQNIRLYTDDEFKDYEPLDEAWDIEKVEADENSYPYHSEEGEWKIDQIEYYTLDVTIEGEGTVEIDPDEDEYEFETEVTLKAEPDENWEFVEWTGDVTEGEEEEGTITITMDDDKEITAVFEELDPAYFEVEIIDYDDEVEEGETVTVEYRVENTGEVEDTQDIVFSVDGTEEDTETEVTLDAGEEYSGEFTWEAEDEGDYELEVASEDDEDTVTVTVEEEPLIPIPGFTTLLLILGSVLAVAVYHKKER